MKPAFLYFDLGNVLLSFSHERMCRQMAAVAGVAAEEIRNALMECGHSPSLQRQFESGQINALAVYELFCEQIGVRPDMHQLFAAARDIFEMLPESYVLIEELASAGHRLGIMSNTNPIDWEFVTAEYPWLRRRFQHAVLSYEVRAMKPDPAIYRAAVSRAGVPAGQVFFTDDRQENVEGALAAGLDAVLFTSAADLRAALRSRGILAS